MNKKLLIGALGCALLLTVMVACSNDEPMDDAVDEVPPVTENDTTPDTDADPNVGGLVPPEDGLDGDQPDPTPVVPPETTPETTPEVTPDVEPEKEPETTPEVEPDTDADTSGDGVSLEDDVWQAFLDKVGTEQVAANTAITADVLSSLYGINSDDLVQFSAYMPMINVKAEEFFIAEVKDGMMDSVKTGIENRQADLEESWQSYLPDQYEIVKDYQLVTNGNYILFAVSVNADQMVDIFNSVTK